MQVFFTFPKFPRGNKKDRDRRQRTDDLSSILPDSHGHPDISSILRFGSMPDYSRWFFSHSQNTFLRDMKPQFGLFVLTFYHILLRFSTKAAVNKPQQNRNSCHQNRNKPRILLPVRDILVPFGLGMVGERHCLSKARSNFDCVEKCFLQQNSCASLVGRPLTDCALLSLFFGCAERYDGTEIVPLPLGFCIGTVWVLSGNSTSAVPVIPCRKGVQ